jgi:hypothetical protein
MNLQSWFNNVAGAGDRVTAGTDFFERFFRQICHGSLSSAHIMKLLSVRARSVAVCLAWALVGGLFASTVSAQTNYYSQNGTEYPVVGSLPGDQVFPDAAISPGGGFMVWQDNATDGDGWGISARRLDATLSGTLGTFRVNVTGAADQENARVALLKNGGAAFVWQGGVEGYQRIFARFLSPTNTFLTTTDLPVSLFIATNSFQVNPAITVLNDSNVVVVWSSFNQAGTYSLLDVYAKILSPVGATVKSEFLVNQFTNFNQRTPTVKALQGGGFAVAWVSEQERAATSGNIDETNGTLQAQINLPSVDIYARLFQSNGVPVGNEFLVNVGSSPSANPNVAAASDGGFMVGWSQRDLTTISNGWDVYARSFTSNGSGATPVRLNTYVAGNQYAPHLSAVGLDYLAVWTSMGQDGSREGVYGQFVHNNDSLVGGEFRVNGTTVAQQMQPAIASDGASQFMVVWTSYVGSPYNFDLFAQRFINVSSILQPMSAPCVWAPFVLSNNVYQPELVVSWPPLLGLSVSNYEVFVDGNGSPSGTVTTNSWIMTAANGLAAGSTHSFAVLYVTTGGQISPISPSASGTTWSGANYYGIPFEWMEEYYGLSFSTWLPNPNAPRVPGGPSLHQIFVSGGNPLDPTTWLKQVLVKTSQGMFLNWNTQPGATYQVQFTTNFTTWGNFGSPRFASGTNDSINVGGAGGYYRINLLRQ